MTVPGFYKILFQATGYTLAMLLVWIGLDTVIDGTAWAGMQVSKSALTVEYCEFNRVTRFFHQPMNTYSNLAYFFWGVLIVRIAWYDYQNQDKIGQNRLEKFPLLSALMGVSFVYLSFGSAFFHASLTYAGQRVDMNGTYGIMVSLAGIALYHVLYKIRLMDVHKIGWVVCLVMVIGLFYWLALLVSSALLVPALILFLNVLMVINYGQFRKERSLLLIVLSLVLIVAAIKIRTLDVQKVNCDPYSFIQGHAVWHFLTALSSFCSYAFFRFGGTTRRF
ncbi:ceramidase domain-containing protein [Spirosoma spitsbergense]|uniref:ceramidase domain-containing protein n=1 Tax=Spirosoma spitsbergense TaxID=431554 RepID=UPI00037CCDA0|nr:ceramidase domain-containing protein [Spirosoma spitsbergense]